MRFSAIALSTTLARRTNAPVALRKCCADVRGTPPPCPGWPHAATSPGRSRLRPPTPRQGSCRRPSGSGYNPENHPDALSQCLLIPVVNFAAIQQDTSLIRVIEARQQFAQAGFAGCEVMYDDNSYAVVLNTESNGVISIKIEESRFRFTLQHSLN